jgi:hypothetical protein
VADLLKQWLAHLAQPTLILPPKFVAALPSPQSPDKKAPASRWRTWLSSLGIATVVLVSTFLGILGGLDNFPTGPVGPAGRAGPRSTTKPTPSPFPGSAPLASQKTLDLPRDSEFAAELAQAAEATYALEVESANAIAPGQSIADELAGLESRIMWLEAETSAQFPRVPEPQPIPDAVPRLTEPPSPSER